MASLGIILHEVKAGHEAQMTMFEYSGLCSAR
jgi:hypothetical protein